MPLDPPGPPHSWIPAPSVSEVGPTGLEPANGESHPGPVMCGRSAGAGHGRSADAAVRVPLCQKIEPGRPASIAVSARVATQGRSARSVHSSTATSSAQRVTASVFLNHKSAQLLGATSASSRSGERRVRVGPCAQSPEVSLPWVRSASGFSLHRRQSPDSCHPDAGTPPHSDR